MPETVNRSKDWTLVERLINERVKKLCAARPHPRLAENVSLRIVESAVPEDYPQISGSLKGHLRYLLKVAFEKEQIFKCDEGIEIEILPESGKRLFEIDWWWCTAVPDRLVDDLLAGTPGAKEELQKLRNRRS